MALSSIILVTVRVGWQDDIQLDPEGKGESEQDLNAVLQDGEQNADYAPEQLLMNEPTSANGPEDESENGGLGGQLPTDEVIDIDDESKGAAEMHSNDSD